NARFLPMGIAAAPAFKGGPLRRAAEGQTLVDASWALANDEGRFDRGLLIGATLPQFVGWVGGTIVGALAGPAIGDPKALGLDARAAGLAAAGIAVALRARIIVVILLAAAATALVRAVTEEQQRPRSRAPVSERGVPTASAATLAQQTACPTARRPAANRRA